MAMRRFMLVALIGLLAGCAGDRLRGESYRPTDNDTPFGGGFPASHHPDGDPYDANSRRTEIRVRSDAPLTGESRSQK